MHRRVLLASAFTLLAALPAAAAGYETDIIGQLRGLGFEEVVVEHTLLGRTRLLAIRDDGTREIILNPRTGEILRDLWVATDRRSRGGGLIDNSGGSGSDDDDDDDDDGDDGDGDDDSGSGSGSGSDSSGSGSRGGDRSDDD